MPVTTPCLGPHAGTQFAMWSQSCRSASEVQVGVLTDAEATATRPMLASSVEMGKSRATAAMPRDVASVKGTANQRMPPSRYPFHAAAGVAAMALCMHAQALMHTSFLIDVTSSEVTRKDHASGLLVWLQPWKMMPAVQLAWIELKSST